jgi:hypothetical protein
MFMVQLNYHKTARLLLIAAAFALLMPGSLFANELSDERVRIGLDLFPSLLAADADIAAKKCADGNLHLLLVHAGRERFAREMAERLSQIKEIRGIPIRVSLVAIEALGETLECPIAGIFLSERVGDGLSSVIRFGRDRHAVLFSPFPGDVEKGVASGILISDRILPYVNLEALRLSGVHIKSFFFGIAEHYGD